MSYAPEIIDAAKRLHIHPEAVQAFLDAGQGKSSEGTVRSVHTTIKAIGSACNLDCVYCYYLSKEELLGQKKRRMQEDVLEHFVREYIAAQDAEEIAFSWHGGEPTLLGLPFFRRVVALQQKYLPPGRRVANDLQTNGTLLDDAWCAFFAEHGFMIGISLDGPRDLHDVYRPTKRGKPSFDAVFAGTQLLRKHGVPFGTLSTVNRKNAREPERVYPFLRDEVGARFMQFIPCVEPRQFARSPSGAIPDAQLASADSPRARPDHPLSIVTDWSVDPEDWGHFLARVFDLWRARDQGVIKINLFESMFAQLQGKPSLLCTSSPFCGKNLAVEHDGRVYSCDHFVYPEHELGTLGAQTFAELAFSMKQLAFGLDKYNSLPSECRECPHLKLCWGECPRTRILKTREGEGRLSYLCRGWKIFYAHALPKIGTRKLPEPALYPATSLVRHNTGRVV